MPSELSYYIIDCSQVQFYLSVHNKRLRAALEDVEFVGKSSRARPGRRTGARTAYWALAVFAEEVQVAR